MKMRTLTFLGVCLLLGSMSASAQVQNKSYFQDEDGNTFHQIFMDFKVTEIIEMKYADETTPEDGEISSDGYSIVIKNYPGEKSVKMKVLDASGQVREVIKSRCFIDPVLLHL